MTPDDQNNRRVGTPLNPQRSFLQPTPRDASAQAAAANIARGQLDHLYAGNTTTPTPQTTPVATEPGQSSLDAQNPYEQTQTNPATVQAEQWKQYHSAWQDYYQKYYERYYVGQVYRARQALEASVAAGGTKPQPETPAPAPTPSATFDRDEAMYDLRAKLINQLQTSAKKVRKSRHFWPITSAIIVMCVFLFLQYNSILFGAVEAYVSPGDIDPANIIVTPSSNIPVGPDPELIIPKINVDAPIDFTDQPTYDSLMAAMAKGVAYFGIPGADSMPGQVGNMVISGHSSNDIFDTGGYKFIFARINQLSAGDTIYVNYKSVRYTYTVTGSKVVSPTDVQALVYPTTQPLLTLITCTPVGTSLNRLFITAEQVSPSPEAATAAPKTTSAAKPTSIPGNSPTLLERMFGG